MGMIWMVIGVGSLVLGPFVGFDRRLVKVELKELWMRSENSNLLRLTKRVLIIFSYIGFFIPALYPIFGIIISLIFFMFVGR